MGIGKNVHALRKQKGLTYESVAEAVGTHPQAISQMEKRGSKSSTFATALAKLFEVSVEDLLSEDFDIERALAKPVAVEVAPPPAQLHWVTPVEAELLSLFRACGDGEQGTVLSIARSLPKAIVFDGIRDHKS